MYKSHIHVSCIYIYMYIRDYICNMRHVFSNMGPNHLGERQVFRVPAHDSDNDFSTLQVM